MNLSNITLKLFSIGVFFTLSQIGCAQKLALSFHEAVQKALEENIQLKTEKNQLVVNKAEQAQGKAQFLPDVSAFAQFRRQNGNQFITQEAKLVNTTTQDFYPEISANLTIFNAFRNVNGLKMANHNLEAQQFRVKRTEQDIIYNVALQYLTVLFDKELIRIAEENIESQNTILERIKGFVDVGEIFIGDQYNQESQIKSLELALVEATNTMENDKSLLGQTLMLQPLLEFDISTPQWAFATQLVEEYQLKELYQTALGNRSDLKELNSLKQSSEYQNKMAKAGYYPTLGAFFSYNSYYNNTATRPIDPSNSNGPSEKIPFDVQIRENNPNSTIGLRLSIPIFSNYQNRTNVITSKILMENANLNIKNQEQAIYVDVQTALQNYRAAIARYESAEAQFDAAKIAMETQTARYELGNATIIDVTTTTNAFIQSEVDMAQAKYRLMFQKILLEYQTGTLDINTLPEE
ncbi:MAG: TolC family protein [Flammeovirgaceae bacterium]|nr:TolC family protein [Flammeovirgaceae bacterium]